MTSDEIRSKYYPTEEEFTVLLPAGVYYMGDPCYALLDTLYDNLISPRWEDNRAGANAVVDTPLGRLVVWSTGGDGIFSGAVNQLVSNFPPCATENRCISLGVDSGSLSLIPLALATNYDPAHPIIHQTYGQLHGHFTLEQPHEVRVKPNGNVQSVNYDDDDPGLDIMVTDEDDSDDDSDEGITDE